MALEKEYLDAVLVPSGLLIMVVYHLSLLHRYLHHPLTTVMGYENQDKKVWVDKIMQVNTIYSSILTIILFYFLNSNSNPILL